MNRVFLIIFLLIVGLVGAKELVAEEARIGAMLPASDNFRCKDPVPGEFLIKLTEDEINRDHRVLKLNRNNNLEIASYGMSGEVVVELTNVEFKEFQELFRNNNYKITKSEPLQSIFLAETKDESGNIIKKEYLKSKEGSTSLLNHAKEPIIKISFEKISKAKHEKSFEQQRKELRSDYKKNKRYSFQSLTAIINYTKEIGSFELRLNDFIKQHNKSTIDNNKIKFIIPVCNNVKEASYAPSPPFVNDEAFTRAWTWGLKQFINGFWYGPIYHPGVRDVDLNYNDGWRMMYQVWQHLSPNRRVMSIVDSGLDDRPGGQNMDLVNKIDGSFIASGLGPGSYYDFTGSTHGLKVTGIALAEQHNIFAAPGFTKGQAFLSVCSDGTPITNADFIEAIDAAGLNSNLINLSLGYTFDPAITSTIQGLPPEVLIVAAAGNSGLDLDNLTPGIEFVEPVFPCALGLPNTLCVAGIGPTGALGTFGPSGDSNWGATRVHTGAPAQDMFVLLPGDSFYISPGGTSWSAPHITGMVAAVKDFRPSLSVFQIKDLITDSANNRTTLPAPLEVVSTGIPDFKLVLDAAANLVPCGDINQDGSIDVLDALAVAQSTVGLRQVRDIVADDFNGDGVVSVLDALSIARFAVRLPEVMSCPGSRVN